MNTLDKPVLQALDDYKAAVLAKSVDAFVALYDQHVLVFDMWGAWSYNGIAAWRQMVEGWFGSLGTERVIVDFSDAQTITADDLAVVHAFVSYKAIDTNGVELRSMDNRTTMTLGRNSDGWKIVHQHTSSPIDGSTTQAIFRRR
ncbi:YybH family protein [Paraburkholderia sp. ZP32-5]|uniref:YybH family protein n=1 Tax=Paraburkholderia sp. ZP32-5 TaxID=2883245 RepID=UPI001F451CDA|nr:nuclear transport factor 2 family protein [Paraburkholderia sp. ZP32-5]